MAAQEKTPIFHKSRKGCIALKKALAEARTFLPKRKQAEQN